MPAIYLFEKRTFLAGDDLHFLAFITISLRLVQVFCLASPLSILLLHDAHGYQSLSIFLFTDPADNEMCRNSHFYPLLTSIRLLFTFLFALASILLEYKIWTVSSQGTPTTIREPRTSKIQGLLEFRLKFMSFCLPVLILTYIVAVVYSNRFISCREQQDDNDNEDVWIGSQTWKILNFLLFLSQAVEGVMTFLFSLRLRRYQNRTHDERQGSLHSDDLGEEIWTDRCHWFCKCLAVSTCCLFGGKDLVNNHNPAVATNNVYRQVAIALAEYLTTRGTLDVVPTDLMTGLFVLQQLQRKRMLQARLQVIRSSLQQRQNHGGQDISTPSNTDINNNLTLRRSPRSSDHLTNSSWTRNVCSHPSAIEESVGEDQQEQNIYRRASDLPSHQYEARARQVLNPNNAEDCDILREGARMAKYALAIYTWMLYVFVHPITGLPKICCRSCRLCCRKERRQARRQRQQQESSLLIEEGGDFPITVGDNLCQWHKHALLLVAELEEADLVYAQFENRFSLMPYCIMLDHESRAVVVSIRGSLSLEDLVTDALVDPEPLQELGEEFGFDATNQYCHAGVLACVKNIYEDMQRHGLLETLLEDEFPTYQLRLVGPSLGAASATLLGYMLKAKYNNLVVYNFSPPGCSMTWDLATRCKEWATTFIFDSDIVPRLSVLSMEDLRDEVLQLIGRIKVPKYQVFETFIPRRADGGYCFGGSISGESAEEDLGQELAHLNQNISEILDDSDSTETLYYRQLQEFLSVQEQLKQTRDNSRLLRLYPVGKMIHLVKTHEEVGFAHTVRRCLTCYTTNSGSRYTPIYIDNDDLDEVVVTPTMGTDHFVDRMSSELGTVAREYEERRQQMDISSHL